MTDLVTAIKTLRPNSSFSVEGEIINWGDTNNAQPTQQEIDDKIEELKAEYDAKQYQRDRAESYDPITEQLDQIYWDMDGWKARIKSVKDKYPKP
jgi:hypothetical protein